jgi:tetratricopeptide (TPR) repeat protein
MRSLRENIVLYYILVYKLVVALIFFISIINGTMLASDNGFRLDMKWQFPKARRYLFAFCALFAVLFVIYGNSLQGEWHFDDHYNITENVNVHLKDLSWEQIKDTFHIRGVIRRPVSYFIFALNYYAGGLDTFGYHLVNLMIHYITSVFLFLIIYNTLRLPLLRERYGKSAYAIALLSSFLWAVNPLQVTAVSIIVQRMASMAGMFYLISIYSYLKGRTTESLWKSILFFILSVLAALLAFGTKQNAAMLPVVMFLYDLFLIQGISKETIKINAKIFMIPLLILLALGIYFTGLSSLLAGYESRPFTLTERLLTEPRIVVFYLSLLFYPLSSRLALLHDIDISTSLFHPFTTLPAILLILSTFLLACFLSRRRPLIAFSIIFFFVNHIIESSVIPLELIYEHRNYIPSMFIFVPIGILLIHVLDYFSYRKSLQIVVAMGMVVVMVTQGHTVFARNVILTYEKSLWIDNILKYPTLSRPHSNLGKTLFREGNYLMALLEYAQSLEAARYSSLKEPLLNHVNAGNCYLMIEGHDDRALDQYSKAIGKYGALTAEAYDGMAFLMLKKGDTTLSKNYIEKALTYKPNCAVLHNNYALILLKYNKLDEAIREAHTAMTLQKNYADPYPILGEAFRKKGNYPLSLYYWEAYAKSYPENLSAHFALLELYNHLGDKDNLTNKAVFIMHAKGERDLSMIIDRLNERKFSRAYVPDRNRVLPILEASFHDLLSSGMFTTSSTHNAK